MVCKMVPGDYTPAKCYVNTSAMVFASNRSWSDDGQEVRMALIVVRDMTSATLQVGHTTLSLASTVRVNSLLEHVASLANYQNGTFELVLQQHRDSNTIILNDRLNETLESAGFVCDNGQTRNSLIIADMGKGPPVQNEPRSNKMIIEDGGDDEKDKKAILDDETKINEPLFLTGSREYSDCNISDSTSSSKQGIGFVGLVNQAMTCYLNSLIQTLYMTPEFRNALYRWRFEGTAEEQEKSIPFQLQSLFIQLQTTEKASIGTTNLTRSFGWDSSEAWQQHDIQELCRVMFDALEHNFKRTEQADLISRLYEGKMVDYVRCLDCRTEKSREDTFLDIPLPVRPFGSQNAYASVEEALKAFVAPETLDGNNQYWCEKCNKKCDAHKGLKFSRFPYLLTLHLKRFDFDYNTLHRIKLNDKVTFPEILNLESFIEDESTKESHDTAIDDSMSEVSESSRANSSNDPESQDDDEGIDVRTDGFTGSTSSTCDSSESRAKGSRENRRNRSSPACSYELFSIMIHSGSASGGHYYAYIKDFISQQWFCFNDQSVSRITYDDIRRTYGGGPSRSAGYFTSAYTSSTNAYMLMYREIDKGRNANFISPAEFPEHLKRLLERMNKEEEALRQVEENERNTRRIQLYCHHPRRGRIDIPLKVHKDVTLRQATSLAYEKIGDLQDLGIPLERCRLVKYNEFYDSIECSWDDRSDDSVSEILGGIRFSYKFDLLLEIIGEGQQFIVYNYTPDSVSIKIVYVDVDSKEWRTPVSIRLSNSSSVLDLKEAIKSSLNIAEGVDQLYLCRIHHSALRSLNQDDRTLRTERFQKSEKVYATVASADEDEFDLNCKSRFHELIDLYENITTIRVTLPRVDKDILERLGISNTQEYRMIPRTGSPMESFSPDVASDDSLSHLERERALSEGEEEEHDVREDFIEDAGACMAKEDAVHEDFSEGDDHVVEGFPDNRPCLPVSTSSASASEDSSLSLTDSDRTLLGDPRESEDPSSAQSGSQRRNAMAEAEPKEVKYYFKVVSNVEQCGETVSSIMVDKRMSLSQFKLELESLLNVPFDFLLVYKKATYPAPSLFDPTDREWVQPHETLETLGDDNQLLVRLGRVLRPGEIKGKIFQLSINDVNERSKFLFEWVLSTGVKVGSMKREILAEIQLRYGYEIPYNKCILRKKKWRTPSTVYGNEEETFDGELVYMLKNWEMYLQVLDADNAKEVADNYNGAETSVFLRRWRPSTFTLENFVDVPLVNLSRLDLGHKLIELSGTPMERIEVAKAPKTFPCEGSLLAIQDDILWVSLAAEDDSPIFKFPHNVPIRDGDVIYWRDTQEEVKKLTEQERKEILRRENGDESTLVAPTYTAASTSPRKERPLRIYLDTPSVKEDISLD